MGTGCHILGRRLAARVGASQTEGQTEGLAVRLGGRKNVANVALSVLVDSEIETGKLEMQDWLHFMSKHRHGHVTQQCMS